MDLELEPQDELLESGARPVKNVSLRVDVFFLPEFYANNQFAGRSDLRAPRRKIGSLHDTEDLEGTVRQFAKMPGAYFAECRLGRDVVASDVFELKPKGQSLVMESSQTSTPAQPLVQQQPAPQQAEPSSASAINATVETVRATKELLREVAPPATTPQAPTKEEIARMIEESNSKLIAQLQSAQPAKQEAPQDPLASLVNTVNVLKQLGVIKDSEAKAQTADPIESVLNMHERILDAAERMNPEGKSSKGWLDKTLGAVETVAQAAPRVAPYIAPIVQRAMQGQADTPAQGQPTEQPQPVDELQALTRVAQTIAEEYKAGHRVGRTADLIDATLIQFPTLQPHLSQMLSDEPANIVQVIRSLGVDIPQTRAALEWIADLQAELSDDDEGTESELEPVQVEQNGHRAAHVAQG